MYGKVMRLALLPAGLIGFVAQESLPVGGRAPGPQTSSSGAHAGADEGPGPDLVVSAVGLNPSGTVDDFIYWGTADGIRAFSMAATACNAGGADAESISGGTARHPLIAQHLYRLLDGRFEQVGMSWIKHMFCGGNEFTCGVCQPTDCDTLGIGCADTYCAFTNDTRTGGPRWQIDPQGLGLVDGHAATHTHPFDAPSGPAEIAGRLQIGDESILAGGLFFAEAQYVTHDEPLEDRHNNVSWRQVIVTLTSITGAGAVQAGQPALEAWKLLDETVDIVEIDVPGEGRFHLGSRVYDNGDGTWHYEYALHNLNSDRAARSFAVPIGADVEILSTGFRDIDYHSGDGIGGVDQDGTDWPATVGATLVGWATDTFEANENANALRWGTVYNFRLTADAPPSPGTIQIGLFEPAGPNSISAGTLVPQGCPGDIDADGVVGITDFLVLLGAWGPNPGHPADFDGDGLVGITDFLIVLGKWGACPICGDPLAGSCFDPNGSPGCADAQCCLDVCELEPECCDSSWSDACAQAALVLCRSCGDPGTGSCLEANGTPHCDDEPCCEAVCAVDPTCCDAAWTQACVDLAAELCTGCGGAGVGSCCEANGTPFCDDEACCDLVCVVAPPCCIAQWDTVCAEIACGKGGLCIAGSDGERPVQLQ